MRFLNVRLKIRPFSARVLFTRRVATLDCLNYPTHFASEKISDISTLFEYVDEDVRYETVIKKAFSNPILLLNLIP